MDTITIRPAAAEDADSVYAMVCELEHEELDKKLFTGNFLGNLNRPDIYYWLSLYGGEISGFISLHLQKLLHHNGTVAEIQELIVKDRFRGKGLGKLMFEEARRKAREERSILLEVSCNRIRKVSHPFYEHMGLNRSHYKFTQEF